MTHGFGDEPLHLWDTQESLDRFGVVYEAMTDYEAYPRTCSTCREQRHMLAMPGVAWGWQTIHSPACPEHDDHLVAHEVVVGASLDLTNYFEAERILAATVEDTPPGPELGEN